jgi:hypothetical protein
MLIINILYRCVIYEYVRICNTDCTVMIQLGAISAEELSKHLQQRGALF